MSKVRPRHDQLFRKALENPMVTQELLEAHMPCDVFALIDMSSIKIEKESFVEANLINSISDVLLSAKINGEEGYIYVLLEHQSTVDQLMAYRLFKYMFNICDRHLRKSPKAKGLPLVYPLIIYNGKKPYTAARNLWELFADKANAKRFWTEDHNVVNVHEIPDEELKERKWSGIMEFFLKHIHERNLVKKWWEWRERLPEFIKIDIGRNYLKAVLYYTLTHIEEKDKIELERMLANSIEEEGEEFMASIAETWFRQGEAKGMDMGKAIGVDIGVDIGKAMGVDIGKKEEAMEIAERLLANGLDPAFVLSVTGVEKEPLSQGVRRRTARNKN